MAYTQENQVEIRPRQEQHLPHELGHVIQQKPKIVHTNGKHEPNIKAVVQRFPDFFALIEEILKIIPKEAGDLRASLEKFEPKGKPDDMKNLRKLLDEAETLQDSTRQNINKLFFDFYGMEVKHALDSYKARFDLEHFGAYSRESTSMKKEEDEQLKEQGNGAYVAGPGAGTRVYLGSPALDGADAYDINADLVDKQSIVIAHELIHALHAQEGSMPTWKILLGNNYELTESDYKAVFLHHHPEFKDASADDVPTTGIMKDIVYPQPLENIKHINENRIRSELKMVSRDSY